MLKIHLLAATAVLALIAAPAMSQEDVRSSPNIIRRALIGEPFMQSKYWLGIECMTLPASLRSQLNLPEKQGVLVGSVVKDSPAAKAGFAQYDVLLRAGDKQLAEPRDVLAAIDAAKETKLKIDLLRGGKPKTIELTPAKRPEQFGVLRDPASQADVDKIRQWLESMGSGEEGNLQAIPRLDLLRPGMILPRAVLVLKPLPGNMSVTMTKEADQPAKIVVKHGDQKWEITEKELNTLPADVRPYVEQMLGRTVFGVVGGAVPPGMSGGFSSGGTFTVPAPSPGTMQVQPFPPGLDPRLEKRFDDMNRRMDQLLKMMEQMQQGHHEQAAPQHHEEK
jgi:hypothetical protein